MKRPRRTKWIKKRAHELTWAALWWSPFAGLALFGVVTSDAPELTADAIIPIGLVSLAIGLEVVLVAMAIRFWRNEKKQEMDWEFD